MHIDKGGTPHALKFNRHIALQMDLNSHNRTRPVQLVALEVQVNPAQGPLLDLKSTSTSKSPRAPKARGVSC